MTRAVSTTYPGGRLLAVDAIRGACALAVVAIHANTLPDGELMNGPHLWQRLAHLFIYTGDAGLDMLFVISGYLISGAWIRPYLEGRPLPDLGSYARRRICRIMPAFWIALTAIELAPRHEHLGAFVRQMFFLEPPAPGQDFGLFVAWSLQVEIVFYIATPLLCRWAGRRWPDPADRLRVLLIGCGALFVLGFCTSLAAGLIHYGTPWQRPIRFSAPATLDLITPGVLLAASQTTTAATVCPRFLAAWDQLTRGRLLVLAVAVVTALELTTNATGGVMAIMMNKLPRVVVYAAVIAWALRFQERGRRLPVVRVLASVGTVSYGLYLWHCVWLSVLPAEGISHGGGSWGASFLLLLGLSLPCAIASWYVIERPLIRYSMRGSRRVRSTVVAPATTSLPG